MEELFYLMEAKDNESLERIISSFEPKIKKSILQTTIQNREELTQVLKVKMFDCIKKYDMKTIPGFFEFCESVKNTG